MNDQRRPRFTDRRDAPTGRKRPRPIPLGALQRLEILDVLKRRNGSECRRRRYRDGECGEKGASVHDQQTRFDVEVLTRDLRPATAVPFPQI